MNQDISDEIDRMIELEVESMKKECIKLFQEAIQEEVYDVTDAIKSSNNGNKPDYFPRSYLLKQAVNCEMIDMDSMIVQINTDKIAYNSYVNFRDTGKGVSKNVPWLIYHGHNYNGAKNQYGLYKNYAGRDYLQSAYNKIKAKFPEFEISIIADEVKK